jgi:hypothetical protein
LVEVKIVSIYIEQLESGYLYYRLAGTVTEDDLYALHVREHTLFDDRPADWCVNVIADLSDLHTIPPQFLSELRRTHMVRDDHIGVVIVVGANRYLRALATSLGLTIAKHEFVFCDTLDEAYTLLGAHSAGPFTL